MTHTLSRASSQLSLPALLPPPRFRIVKNGQARNAYGQVAQEIVCAALSLEPIPINGSCSICFDAERSGCFYEIKSARRVGGKVVIYDWRMEKEAAARVPLLYAVLCHNVRGSDGSDLLAEMAGSGLELLVMQASVIHALALTYPLHSIKSTAATTAPRAGYNRAGYSKGYRCVPVRALKGLLLVQEKLPVSCYGLRFKVAMFTAAST